MDKVPFHTFTVSHAILIGCRGRGEGGPSRESGWFVCVKNKTPGWLAVAALKKIEKAAAGSR